MAFYDRMCLLENNQNIDSIKKQILGFKQLLELSNVSEKNSASEICIFVEEEEEEKRWQQNHKIGADWNILESLEENTRLGLGLFALD